MPRPCKYCISSRNVLVIWPARNAFGRIQDSAWTDALIRVLMFCPYHICMAGGYSARPPRPETGTGSGGATWSGTSQQNRMLGNMYQWTLLWWFRSGPGISDLSPVIVRANPRYLTKLKSTLTFPCPLCPLLYALCFMVCTKYYLEL